MGSDLKKGLRKDISEMKSNRNMKKGVLLRGLNAMPLRIEARKSNLWATGGVLEKDRKFSGSYMYVQFFFLLTALSCFKIAA